MRRSTQDAYAQVSARSVLDSTLSSLGNQLALVKMDIDGTLHLPQFRIDKLTGFLPPRPLDPLPAYYDEWEKLLSSANHCLSLTNDNSPEALSKRQASHQWHQLVREMPLLLTDHLMQDCRLLQRAHHVLAFLVHFYVHSVPEQGADNPPVIPSSLTYPLVQVSQELGIAPVLTFADTVLWNWELVHPGGEVTVANMRCQTLFTRLRDEEAFYLVSAAIELRGVEVLSVMQDMLPIPQTLDITKREAFVRGLLRLRDVIDELTSTLSGVRQNCRPNSFYYAIRPWFRGSDADGDNSPGWIYENIDDYDELPLSGPSAGQSSTLHALDIFLDIDHALHEQQRTPLPSANNRLADLKFMERMREYMPGSHRAFLRILRLAASPMRNFVASEPTLRLAYNDAVLALKRFRDEHMRIAVLYIITMARASSSPQLQGTIRGTGGTALSNLLKAGRDATLRAIFPQNV